jgi:hypothetical protein
VKPFYAYVLLYTGKSKSEAEKAADNSGTIRQNQAEVSQERSL